jgi:hypothetical protein
MVLPFLRSEEIWFLKDNIEFHDKEHYFLNIFSFMQFLPSTSVNKIEYLHFLQPLKPNAQETDLKKHHF